MKKVGIVCDNYKLKLFKEKLDAHGFTYSVIPFKENGRDSDKLTSIIVDSKEEDISKVKGICEEVELYYKGLKN